MRKQPLWHSLLAISRAYSIPYTILCGLAALGSNHQEPGFATLVLVIIIPINLAVGLAALNDYMHIRQDAIAQRGRDYAPALLVRLGLLGSIATLVAAVLSGWETLLGILLSIVCGLIYARFKAHAGIANLWRGLTSVALILGLAALNQAVTTAVVMACGLGLLDAAGNIYGDIRDQARDSRVGLKTLAVLMPEATPWIASGLFVCAIGLLSFYTPFLWIVLPLVVWVWYTPPYWQHRAFLVLKYLTSIILALAFAGNINYNLIIFALSCSLPLSWWIYSFIHNPATKDI